MFELFEIAFGVSDYFLEINFEIRFVLNDVWNHFHVASFVDLLYGNKFHLNLICVIRVLQLLIWFDIWAYMWIVSHVLFFYFSCLFNLEVVRNAYRLLKISEEKGTKAMLDIAATSIRNSIVLANPHKNKPLKKQPSRQVVMAILLKVFKAQRENTTSGNNALSLLIIIRR